jgi:hypothetical protein
MLLNGHLLNCFFSFDFRQIGHELVIDYDQSFVILFKSKRAIEANAIEIPFTLDEHLPVIEITIGNQKLKMGLYTTRHKKVIIVFHFMPCAVYTDAV